jgi:hypothetical protein
MDWLTILIFIGIGLVALPFVGMLLDFILALFGMILGAIGFGFYFIYNAIKDMFSK